MNATKGQRVFSRGWGYVGPGSLGEEGSEKSFLSDVTAWRGCYSNSGRGRGQAAPRPCPHSPHTLSGAAGAETRLALRRAREGGGPGLRPGASGSRPAEAPWPIDGPCAALSTNGAALQYRVLLPRVAVRPELGAAAWTHSNSGAGDGGREGPKWPYRRQVRGVVGGRNPRVPGRGPCRRVGAVSGRRPDPGLRAALPCIRSGAPGCGAPDGALSGRSWAWADRAACGCVASPPAGWRRAVGPVVHS